jgi:hypothetical protein
MLLVMWSSQTPFPPFPSFFMFTVVDVLMHLSDYDAMAKEIFICNRYLA